MKKQKSLEFLKNAEVLSNDQLKTLMGGGDESGEGTIGDGGEGGGPCRELNVACNQSVQCCSNNCAADSSSSSTGKSCQS